jgi:hypothetical protein
MEQALVDSGAWTQQPGGAFIPVQSVTPPKGSYFAATILNGASVSNKIDLGSLRAGSIIMPSAWTAASLTFLVSHDGTTYSSLYDDTDTEIAILTGNIVAGRARALTIALFLPYRWIQLRSGTTATPVNQGADRVFQILAG